MTGGPDYEDLRLWAIVTSTVRPLRPVHVSARPAVPEPTPKAPVGSPAQPAGPPARRTPAPAPPGPSIIEPGRRRRLASGRDGIAARIDLHGMNQDAARQALTRFLLRAVDEGERAVLVITGRGAGGDGVLRRRVPDWLAEPPLRAHIAGISEAHRRHGGEGACYVALKRGR